MPAGLRRDPRAAAARAAALPLPRALAQFCAAGPGRRVQSCKSAEPIEPRQGFQQHGDLTSPS